ncbi:FAD-binding oxidoreductase [Solihabitans fulvus]|uniref:FAD-binding oxidoreductase n=1 Tax=Solihabitans fulvus TaxID=1892852 RepID=A0A5B2WQ54_9PSEU|nr:FAD-binding oxidoreductase [Solihabitans fulvus]KAA2252910.1 FAD-binding oxidoreductase [Solihabitans fulvus]
MKINLGDVVGRTSAASAVTPAPAEAATASRSAIAAMKRRLGKAVILPDESGFDAARSAYNLAVQHNPLAVVVPETPEAAAEAVAIAADGLLPIGVQSTGHGIGAAAAGGILINTSKLAGVSVNPVGRTARVGGGATWGAVIAASSEHGLAALNGTSDTVGALGFISGGGLPVHGRSYGFAADHVRSLRLVAPDGQILTLSPERHPELFWAVRGGKSNYGLLLEATIDLFPLRHLTGGQLVFPGVLGERVLRAWHEWIQDVPDEMTSAISFLHFPDAPFIPEPLRGQHLVSIRIAYTGTPEHGEELLRPLRALGPVQDDVRPRPYADIARIANDPTTPTPSIDQTGLFDRLNAGDLDTLLSVVGPDHPTAPASVEVRHLGGKLAAQPKHRNAIGPARHAGFTFWMVDLVPGSEHLPRIEAAHLAIMKTMEPLLTGGRFPNFVSLADLTPEAVRSCYAPADYRRLVELKTKVDPHNLFRVNHNIGPAR